MKTVTVTLLQSADNADVFIIQSMRNTVQVAIGQRFTREKVNEWTTLPRVQVNIAGIEQTGTQDADLIADAPQPKIERVDSLKLLSKASV